MSSGPRTSGPRHLAGAAARRTPPLGPRQRLAPPTSRPAPRHRAAGGSGRPPAAEETDVQLAEVTPVARVKRSRLAFALSVTVAALPILVLDNLPATASTDDVQVAAVAGATSSSEVEDIVASSTTADPTTTLAVAPTVAPETTAVEAPTTTAGAPTTTTTKAPVVAVRAAPAPAPTSTTAPPPPPAAYGDPADPATWDRLAQCESHGNWALDSGNGYYGGLQFSLATWQDVGGSGYPHHASREEQIKRGRILQSRYGWGQWPHCSSELGYR